ncbi:MAG TPA: hypothetical protein VFS09_01970 [Candidatus Eisenbacteria bacterium]|nr:hypothetical protein [Candidatus Eisenbacteria bacterium]
MTESALPWVAGVLLPLSLAALLLAGCAAERQVIQPGAGLSADTLRADGLALVGITVLDEVEQLRPPLVATFEKVLAAIRPDLPIGPASVARDALGLPAYRKLLFAYQETGRLEPEEQAALAKALGPGVRYAILARVEKNTVRLSGGGLPQQGSPTMGGSPSMRPPSSASRDARIRFTIYDLAESRGVFEATYASSSDNWAAYRSDAPPEKGSPSVDFHTIGASGDMRESLPESGPDTPSLADALVEGYRAFALDLPAATKKAAPDSSAAR